MRSKPSNRVVVLTGASSGIGKATALLFAERRYRLALAARDAQALAHVAEACRARGTEALVVPTDVTVEEQVFALRDAAVARFGHIDVWVNDAAVYMVGAFERVPSDDVRALFDTNIMGVVHGSKAALSHFRARGRGTLITVGSLAGKNAYAQASAYCASKHAVHALMQSLRQELRGTRIAVSIVAPATVDTPLFDHAANYTGRVLRAMPPVYQPERVARAIVRSARRPKRERLVGVAPRLMSMMQTLVPSLMEAVQPRLVKRRHLGSGPTADTSGNLRQPLPPHREHGGWKRDGQRTGEARGLLGNTAE